MDIKNTLQRLPNTSTYWLTYIAGGILLLAVALFYQYGLEELPCVVCIQIRLWVALLIIVSIVGLFLRKNLWLNIASQIAVVLVFVGFVERSYLLLGTERGFIFGDCGFNAGLPEWFAIEQWMPWLFQVETSCGYTPELIFGITMAEALILVSVSLLVASASVMAISLTGILKKRR